MPVISESGASLWEVCFAHPYGAYAIVLGRVGIGSVVVSEHRGMGSSPRALPITAIKAFCHHGP